MGLHEAPGGGLRVYLEEEVEPKQRTAGDDGKPGCVSTGDRFWHVCCILGGEEKQQADGWTQT